MFSFVRTFTAGLLSAVPLSALVMPGGAHADQKPDEKTAGSHVSAEVLSHAGDYTFGYYPNGWRRSRSAEAIHFAVQTNRYAMLLNGSRATIERIGPLSRLMTADEAVAAGNDVLHRLPAAELSFSVIWNGRPLGVSAGAGSPDQLRLYRVGKYLQHFDVQTVRIGGLGQGGGLEGASGWMEAYCWTDRLAVLLHLAAYRGHLSPPLKVAGLIPTAALRVPEEYPVIELLRPDGTWAIAVQGQRCDTAMLMRNEGGAGIALVVVPGSGQQILWRDDRVLQLEGGPVSLSDDGAATFSCIVVPSADVRHNALQEIRRMRAAIDADVRVTADGMSPYSGPLDVYFDPVKGWHQVILGENRDPWTMERVRLRLANTKNEVCTVRLNFAKAGGVFSITGMSPVLRDPDGYPVGLPVQISKNWHCTPVWFSGLAVLDLPAARTLDLEFDLAYAHWGGVPAVSHAQLCLLGYASNQLWDEMAIGSFGESICYDPDVNLNRSLVDDMRPLMVWGMGKRPQIKWGWTHNVGGCDFLTLYRKDDPSRQFLVRQKTLYESYGPVLTDVTYAGQTPDGAIESRVRTQSWRSDDYVRALYTMRYDVKKPMDQIDRLAFFQLGADHYNGLRFRRITRGSASGMVETWSPPPGGLKYSRRGEKLEGELPWIGLFDLERLPESGFAGDDQGALADKSMILRRWAARLNGVDCPVPLYSVYGSRDGIDGVLIELSPPAGTDRLVPGDYVETQVEVLILPQKADDYYGPNGNLIAAMKSSPESHSLTLREARCTNVKVTAEAGTVEQVWPIRIRAKEGREARFTIGGGVGYTPVTISGAADYRSFVLERIGADGKGETIDQSSPVGRDWWQTQFEPASGTWDVTYTVNLDTPNDRRESQVFQWGCRE